MKFKKSTRFLLSLCLMTLTLLCGGNKAWGQTKITDYTKIVSGKNITFVRPSEQQTII